MALFNRAWIYAFASVGMFEASGKSEAGVRRIMLTAPTSTAPMSATSSEDGGTQQPR
jgi:hypothetical protein